MKSITKTKSKKDASYIIGRYGIDYVMLFPAIIAVFIFSYLPMTGIIIAFKDFNIIDGVMGSPWVGLDNFKEIFVQPAMFKIVLRTLFYGVVLTFGPFPFPIILALLFNELRNLRFKKIVQTVTYMPHFLSWISIVGLFSAFLAEEGTFNQIMAHIMGDGYVAQNILLDDRYFLPVLFVSYLWKSIGWSSIIFLAAITGIDPSLYEAASIDGCSKLKQAWHITLPSIKGTIVIVLVMSLGGLVSTSFEQIFGFQNVFTQENTEVINTFIYRQGIQNGKYSLSTAFGLSQGIVTITLILTANFISKKLMQTSIW